MATRAKHGSLDLIKSYLKEFRWAAQDISSTGEDHTIILLADLENEENIEIKMRFQDYGKWIYFSTILRIDEKKDKFKLYEELLKLNYATTLTKFGIGKSGTIYALIELPLPSLDYNEFVSALKRLVNDVNNYYKS